MFSFHDLYSFFHIFEAKFVLFLLKIGCYWNDYLETVFSHIFQIHLVYSLMVNHLHLGFSDLKQHLCIVLTLSWLGSDRQLIGAHGVTEVTQSRQLWALLVMQSQYDVSFPCVSLSSCSPQLFNSNSNWWIPGGQL